MDLTRAGRDEPLDERKEECVSAMSMGRTQGESNGENIYTEYARIQSSTKWAGEADRVDRRTVPGAWVARADWDAERTDEGCHKQWRDVSQ